MKKHHLNFTMLKPLFSPWNLASIFLIGVLPPVLLLLIPRTPEHAGLHKMSLDIRLWDSLGFSITATTLLFFGTVFIIQFLQNKIHWHRHTVTRLLTEFIAVAGFAFVGMYLISGFFYRFVFHDDHFKADLLLNEKFAVTIAIIVTLFMESRYFLNEWKNAIIRNEEIKNELTVAKYNALKSQVNPHFLFNTLNTLTALVYKEPDKAVEFTIELSKVYRYVLETNKRWMVTLSQELDFLESYFFLQKIRFGDGLSVELDIPAGKMQELVPPLALHLLAENAIKHNEISSSKPLHIQIIADKDFIVVKNPLQPRNASAESSGFSQQNLKKRYAAISERLPEFQVNDKYYCAKIPLITEDEFSLVAR